MTISSIGSLGNWATPQDPATQIPARRQVVRAAKAINESSILGENQLVFSIDSETRREIIRIENRDTHEVVLQIPPEYVLRLAQQLHRGSAQTLSDGADT